MAGRKLIVQTKVGASTILEVVISMVIIILVFGIAMMIYSNVTRLSLSAKKIQAQAVLQELMQNFEQSKEITSQSVVSGDYTIEQSVKPYGENTNLIGVSLTAYDDNHQEVAELQKVILRNDD
jgi:Tfp pilus assembly protein PilE